ncbi:hypothetical protein EMCRGX_G018688 [Ephydatia muelleri]
MKGTPGLAKSVNNTYLTNIAAVSKDINTISNLAVPRINGINPLKASYVQPDTSPPIPLQFLLLDLNTLILKVNFTEPVDPSTFAPSLVTLFSAASGGISYTLTGGTPSLVAGVNGLISVLQIKLSDKDVINLHNISGIATTTANTFISFMNGAIKDFTGNSIYNVATRFQAVSVITDTSKVSLAAYTLNMNSNTLTIDLQQRDLATSSTNTFLSMTSNVVQDYNGFGIVAIVTTNALQAIVVFQFSKIMNPSSYNPSGFTFQTVSNASGVAFSSYTLTAGSAYLGMSYRHVNLNLTTVDLNALKMEQLTAADAYLSVAYGAMFDTANNSVVPISPSRALLASTFAPDIIPPSIVGATLDLNVGALLVTFTEAVIASSFNQRVSIQTTAGLNMFAISLSSAEVFVAPHSSVIQLLLSDANLNTLKLNPGGPILTTGTYVTINTSGIMDYSGLGLTNNLTTTLLAQVVLDTIGPLPVNASLDLTLGLLSITYNEAINAIVNVSTLSILHPVSGSLIIQLDSSTVPSFNGRIATFTISSSSVNTISSSVIGLQNVTLSIASGLLTDILGQLSPSGVVPYASLSLDNTPPVLQQYTMDMNTGLIQLTFSKSINANNLSLNQITLQNLAQNPTASIQLTSGNLSVQANTLSIQLTQSQLKLIKELGSVGYSTGSTFLSIQAGSLTDLLGNAISSAPPLQATSIVPNSVAPVITQFAFAFTNNGSAPAALTLTFTEPINASSIILSGLVLQNTSTGIGASYILKTSRIPSIFASTVPIVLTNEDLNGISSVAGLGVSASSTYLNVIAGAVSDGFGVSVAPTNLAVTLPLIDLLPPTLLSFTLDLTQRVIVFSFDQPVQGSTFNSSMLTIQSAASNTLTPFASYTFSGAGSVYQAQSNTISLTCSQADIDGINGILGLAISQNTTYISLAEGLVRDTSGYPSYAIITTNALMASMYTPNIATTLTLISFTVNMNPGAPISLTFSDTVLASSINAKLSSYILTNALNGPTLNATFAGAQPILSSSTIVNIYLSFQTRDYLLANMPNIATTISNTYLSIPAQGAQTKNGLYINAVVMMATNVIPNTMSPSISAFAFDFNSGQLNISFDSSVQGSTFNISAFLLQSAPASPAITYSILSPLSPQTGVIASISLSVVPDLSNLKLLGVCTSAAKCYLSFARNAFQDVFNTPSANGTLPVGTYIADTVGPSLSNTKFASFNLGTGTFVLEFNEPVQPLWFVPSGIHLNSLFSAKDSLANLTLTGGSMVTNGRFVTITLSTIDLIAIQTNPNLCTWRGNCYITLDAGTFKDVSTNYNMAASEDPSLIVLQFIADSVHPFLLQYTLDMNASVLVLNFSKPVNPATLHPNSLTMQDASNGSVFYSLTDSQTSSSPGTVISIALSQTDLNLLKNTLFAKPQPNVYISLYSSAISDLARIPNSVVSISRTAGLLGRYVPDTTPPVLLNYTLDLQSNNLVLTFSEPVNTNMLVITQLSFTSPPLTLTGGTITSSIISTTHIITITLLSPDIINIKSSKISQTYLTFPRGTASDIAGNPINALTATIPAVVIPDISPPHLTSFTLNMVTGTLTLLFNDVVLPSTFNPPSITLPVKKYESLWKLLPAHSF